MSGRNLPAFPLHPESSPRPNIPNGLTKREYAAIHLAGAIVAAPESANRSYQEVAERAWMQADALFTALEQTR